MTDTPSIPNIQQRFTNEVLSKQNAEIKRVAKLVEFQNCAATANDYFGHSNSDLFISKLQQIANKKGIVLTQEKLNKLNYFHSDVFSKGWDMCKTRFGKSLGEMTDVDQKLVKGIIKDFWKTAYKVLKK